MMGGLGSGNWYRWSTRPVVEDGLTLDLCRLIRHRNVVPGSWVSGSLTWRLVDTREVTASIGYEANLVHPDDAWMRLHYRRNDEPEDYRVRLTTTQPNFGGLRWWFVCPAKRINTAKLYLPNGGDWFASRQAYRLAYRSQNHSKWDRQAERAHELRRRIGGPVGFDQPFPDKPKGMHWKTYNRICEEIESLEYQSMSGAFKRFGLLL